jgi:hypothetical protein
MNVLLIFQLQTKSEATIEIMFLLAVAAIIGFTVAWRYYKAVLGTKTEAVESEKNELNNRIYNLDHELIDLKYRLNEKRKRSDLLHPNVKIMNAFSSETALKTNDIESSINISEQLFVEKDKAPDLFQSSAKG